MKPLIDHLAQLMTSTDHFTVILMNVFPLIAVYLMYFVARRHVTFLTKYISNPEAISKRKITWYFVGLYFELSIYLPMLCFSVIRVLELLFFLLYR